MTTMTWAPIEVAGSTALASNSLIQGMPAEAAWGPAIPITGHQSPLLEITPCDTVIDSTALANTGSNQDTTGDAGWDLLIATPGYQALPPQTILCDAVVGSAEQSHAIFNQDMQGETDWDPLATIAGHQNPLLNTNSCNTVCTLLGDGRWICRLNDCFCAFNRYQELARHQNSKHFRTRSFPCRSPGCSRAQGGFSRKDNRDTHEKKIHGAKFD
ncbi:hypothetical protein BX600DRAFT_157348 [Xylariales sp. PMI_506]|nr:hypothetical protein BX600DRAFT_157348 [Xylariales sp. PMI_506]